MDLSNKKPGPDTTKQLKPVEETYLEPMEMLPTSYSLLTMMPIKEPIHYVISGTLRMKPLLLSQKSNVSNVHQDIFCKSKVPNILA